MKKKTREERKKVREEEMKEGGEGRGMERERRDRKRQWGGNRKGEKGESIMG